MKKSYRKIISTIKIQLFGIKAYTKNSEGKIYRGEYYLYKGKVEIGDLVFIDRK